MRILLVLAATVGCGDDGGGEAPRPDTKPIDAVASTLDCPSYCDQIQATCNGENAQYPDRAHCLAACATFEIGSSAVSDTSGDTLGCRIYHAGVSRDDPELHCSHAGPIGDDLMANPAAVCSRGDICASFCAFQFKACGTLNAPLSGNPRDENGNPLFQYRNMTDCMTVCAAFDKTHPYRPTSTGDSLACRLRHTVRAALDRASATAECRHTGMVPLGPCAGAPTP